MPHIERALGRFDGQGFAEPEWNVPFSAFRWSDVPEAGVDTLVSFGLSRHVLGPAGPRGRGRRQEIAIALRRSWQETATSIVVTTGVYMLERHMPFDVGETVRIPPELETAVEAVVVRSANDLVPGLGVCAEYDPPVEILWLEPLDADDPYSLGPTAASES